HPTVEIASPTGFLALDLGRHATGHTTQTLSEEPHASDFCSKILDCHYGRVRSWCVAHHRARESFLEWLSLGPAVEPVHCEDRQQCKCQLAANVHPRTLGLECVRHTRHRGSSRGNTPKELPANKRTSRGL